MARPTKVPPSPSSLVPAIARYARAQGLDVELLCYRFGLPPDVEEREEASVPPLVPNEMLDAIYHVRGDANLALHLAAELPSRRYGLAELAAKASPTVRDALTRLARYAPLLHAAFEAELAEDAGEGRWRVHAPHHPRGLGRFVHELALAYALTQCRSGTDAALAPSRVWFAHHRPSDLAPLHAFFGTQDLSFGEPDSGFALPRELLDGAMRGGDERMLATIEPLAEAALKLRPRTSTLTARVTAHLEADLPRGADVAEVARAMHMSPRTLQRRLEQEGTRFTELLDGVRLDLARRWLADRDTTLADVAFRLGFADLATFSRAFKRWTGKPPGQWRRL